MRLCPKNWGTFQHYKDRNPRWIKLHRELLDDFAFQRLPVASRALAPMLWLLASEYEDGVIVATAEELAFRLRTTEKEITGALNPLIEANFFSVEQAASNPLAGVERAASLEKRREREETEREKEGEQKPGKPGGSRYPSDFEDFWTAYKAPPNSKKPDALKAWETSEAVRPPLPDLLAAVAGYNSWLYETNRKRRANDQHPKQHAATWLRGEVWNGFAAKPGSERPEDVARLVGAWGGRAAALVEEIGPAQFAAWFTGSSFKPGADGAVIRVQKPFAAKWANDHFGGALKRHFGENCRVEAAAA